MLAAWFLAYNYITFSTILMLVFEGVSVALIVMLAFLALAKTGVADPAQWHPAAGHGLKDIGLGVVVAIFSLVGFECATAFGEEARNPLKTIPRAVIASLLLTGAFFVFITYVETHALANNVPTLDKLDAPLSTLSENLGVKWMGVLISIGAMISFFALALSCLNAGARVLFTMGRYGIFPDFRRQLAQAKPHAARGDHRCSRRYSSSSRRSSFSCRMRRRRRMADGARSTPSTTRGCSERWAFAGPTC